MKNTQLLSAKRTLTPSLGEEAVKSCARYGVRISQQGRLFQFTGRNKPCTVKICNGTFLSYNFV